MNNVSRVKTTEVTTTPVPVGKNTQLQDKVKLFLELLYKYDNVGKQAYYKKEKTFDKHLKSDYHMVVGQKYLWIYAPCLKLGVTDRGLLFWPKNYRSFSGRYLGNINWFLEANLWGKKIQRVHTSAQRGLGYRYESAEIHYYNLRYTGPTKRRHAFKLNHGAYVSSGV